MKVTIKERHEIYDLEPIVIGNIKYTRTSPILIDNLYGKEIEVELCDQPQYTFKGSGWYWCKEWIKENK